MKRLVAVTALAGWCVLSAVPTSHAQTLKERSLSDPAPQNQPTPAQQPTPPAPTSVGTQNAPQYAQPAPQSGQPAQAAPQYGQPAQAAPQYAQPAPAAPQYGQPAQAAPQYGQPAQAAPQYAPPPAGSPPPPNAQMPPPGGGTPINGQAVGTPPPPPPPVTKPGSYNRDEVNREVMGFFESGSRGLAEMVARPFHDLGQPTGFIKGNEGGGALIVGLRYGVGTLHLKGYPPLPVYWQSPSVGFDLGVNAGKVFTLVYGMTRPEQIFQRFPGVDGSAYILGGFGMNYQRSGDITLAPIRMGVGLRLGANIGYQVYTRNQEVNPF
ncbi:EipA family protein [Desulfovibrio sp. TomC]|uniref:EipA family protein n=1 Tax=Desulfovibrio sp. TomC TaxID=1562888 RepID=UPI000573989D|nr:EipA family protein [Desulfovibrio sp. TomC]KHK03083.1 hypothetical protein NY78_1612 [Desulfovibrio sp. TomC]